MPDQTMIERMAQALKQALHGYDAGDGAILIDDRQSDESLHNIVRAVLTAMREPTEAMVLAAASQEVTFAAEGNSYIGKIAIEYSSDRDKGADTLYRAMIDAALKDGRIVSAAAES